MSGVSPTTCQDQCVCTTRIVLLTLGQARIQASGVQRGRAPWAGGVLVRERAGLDERLDGFRASVEPTYGRQYVASRLSTDRTVVKL